MLVQEPATLDRPAPPTPASIRPRSRLSPFRKGDQTSSRRATTERLPDCLDAPLPPLGLFAAPDNTPRRRIKFRGGVLAVTQRSFFSSALPLCDGLPSVTGLVSFARCLHANSPSPPV